MSIYDIDFKNNIYKIIDKKLYYNIKPDIYYNKTDFKYYKDINEYGYVTDTKTALRLVDKLLTEYKDKLITVEQFERTLRNYSKIYGVSIDVLINYISNKISFEKSLMAVQARYRNDKQQLEEEQRKIEEQKKQEEEKLQALAEQLNNERIDRFIADITKHSSANVDFRGWILPDGQMISQFYDDAEKTRQDHGRLVAFFMEGLKEYDSDLSAKMQDEFNKYRKEYNNVHDPFESFAVERLGWMQVGVFGRRNIICRGERFQDNFLAPFIVDKGFNLTYQNNGRCLDHLFMRLYPNFKEIIKMGLEKTHTPDLAEARLEVQSGRRKI